MQVAVAKFRGKSLCCRFTLVHPVIRFLAQGLCFPLVKNIYPQDLTSQYSGRVTPNRNALKTDRKNHLKQRVIDIPKALFAPLKTTWSVW